MPGVCAPQQEKSPQWEARAQQGRIAPACCNLRKHSPSSEDPAQPKTNFKKRYRPIIYGFFRALLELVYSFGYRKSWGCIFNNCLSPYYLFSVLIFVFLLCYFMFFFFFSFHCHTFLPGFPIWLGFSKFEEWLYMWMIPMIKGTGYDSFDSYWGK